MLERNIDVAFVSEVWEQSENKEHMKKIEEMLEIDGLHYLSKSRPITTRGGGVAIIVKRDRFTLRKLDEVFVPNNLEVIWGLLRPKNDAKFRNIVVCCFYIPPGSRLKSKLVDHLIEILHWLTSKYQNCGILMGADRNSLDLSPLLNCGLRLKQLVDRPTHNGSILDVLITNLSSFYVTPAIVPPIQPDNPEKAKPSDHSVAVSWPFTQMHNPPPKNWIHRNYRPITESKLREFGAWITQKNWDELSSELTATEESYLFECILKDNLNRICPMKHVKISSHDKPWLNFELKKLHRQKSREYVKRGKSEKYFSLSKEFKEKYRNAASTYLYNNVELLKECNPRQAYATLRRLGSVPGEDNLSTQISLPEHVEENLTAQQSVERIADHFANISNQYPPLKIENLSDRVQTKLRVCRQKAPTVTAESTWRKICAARKPKSGIPGELPNKILKEFPVEFAKPLSSIINKIVSTGQWPKHWKKEYITPIGKVPEPQSENDLRPISLTPFFSKVTEHFIVE